MMASGRASSGRPTFPRRPDDGQESRPQTVQEGIQFETNIMTTGGSQSWTSWKVIDTAPEGNRLHPQPSSNSMPMSAKAANTSRRITSPAT